MRSPSSIKSWRHQYLLFTLSEMGAYHKTIKVSTKHLAEKLGNSQQTASRHLIELDKLNLIKRSITNEGCLITLTDIGKAQIKNHYSRLKMIIETPHPLSITLEGLAFSGLGEGAYYIKQNGYRKQFIEKLGFDPYPGTLNIKLTDTDIATAEDLKNYPAIEIEKFENGARSFGSVKCYPTLINNKVKGAIIVALRTHYDSSVLEIISPHFLRNKMKINDGQIIRVEIFTMP
jgi:riboflavin kinase